MVGALFLAVPMHGGEFIALMMMKAVGAVSFALPVFGVRPKNPESHARAIRRVVDNCIQQKSRTQLKKD
jgi:hypothetical protein